MYGFYVESNGLMLQQFLGGYKCWNKEVPCGKKTGSGQEFIRALVTLNTELNRKQIKSNNNKTNYFSVD